MADPAINPDDHDGTESAGALFVNDDELRRRINPKMGRDRFKATIKQAELDGFPKIHPLWGGRYWPNVRSWLDSQNKVAKHAAPPIAEDGPENFDAAPRKRAGPQARPQQSAILDGQTGHARSHGVSRHLHSVASGRDR